MHCCQYEKPPFLQEILHGEDFRNKNPTLAGATSKKARWAIKKGLSGYKIEKSRLTSISAKV
jgi:hypothetical protein